MGELGIIIIGRNEGDRLRRCLSTVGGGCTSVMYVDSGSTDGSVAAAREAGTQVVELDPAGPFTAARARNMGFDRLTAGAPHVEFVQFIDGDCEMCDGWIEEAERLLREHPEVAVVCGRVVERHPKASIYNQLCQFEWDAPAGEARACGGIAMYRVAAFRAAGGFNPGLIAGEEPELCLRLRRAGGMIWRLDRPMCLHDAGMTRFGQWWKRAMRGGHAYAEGADLHGRSPDRHYLRETRSNWFWGMLLPLVAVALAWPTRGLSLALLVAYPLLVLRVYRWGRRRGWSRGDARLYAFFCVLAKFPQVLGQLRYHVRRLRGAAPRIIEYKTPAREPTRTPCE